MLVPIERSGVTEKRGVTWTPHMPYRAKKWNIPSRIEWKGNGGIRNNIDYLLIYYMGRYVFTIYVGVAEL